MKIFVSSLEGRSIKVRQLGSSPTILKNAEFSGSFRNIFCSYSLIDQMVSHVPSLQNWISDPCLSNILGYLWLLEGLDIFFVTQTPYRIKFVIFIQFLWPKFWSFWLVWSEFSEIILQKVRYSQNCKFDGWNGKQGNPLYNSTSFLVDLAF